MKAKAKLELYDFGLEKTKKKEKMVRLILDLGLATVESRKQKIGKQQTLSYENRANIFIELVYEGVENDVN